MLKVSFSLALDNRLAKRGGGAAVGFSTRDRGGGAGDANFLSKRAVRLSDEATLQVFQKW